MGASLGAEPNEECHEPDRDEREGRHARKRLQDGSSRSHASSVACRHGLPWYRRGRRAA
jgi:hypothetical protein